MSHISALLFLFCWRQNKSDKICNWKVCPISVLLEISMCSVYSIQCTQCTMYIVYICKSKNWRYHECIVVFVYTCRPMWAGCPMSVSCSRLQTPNTLNIITSLHSWAPLPTILHPSLCTLCSFSPSKWNIFWYFWKLSLTSVSTQFPLLPSLSFSR